MKRFLILIGMLVLLAGCNAQKEYAPIAATTLPVYEFTSRLCENTPLTVTRLVTEQVSCLHDYSLNVRQVKAAEAAQVVVISGAGLEDFMEEVLRDANCIDASAGIPLITPEVHTHEDHDHNDTHDGHHHEEDPHIWLSPENARRMAQTICEGLCGIYPEFRDTFHANLEVLCADLTALQTYGEQTLAQLSCRDLITFHDGFSYFARSFDLTVLRAVEEASGSEASARELIELIEEVEHHSLPAIFTEVSGSCSAASVVARETGAVLYTLDMAMAGDSYFDAMYHNIDTIKEALK